MWFRDRKPREYVIRKAKSYLIPFYGYSLLILTIDFILFRDKDFFVASIIVVLRGEGSEQVRKQYTIDKNPHPEG